MGQGPERPAFLTIGTITSPRGVRGEVNVFPHTDRPERFRALRSAWLGRDGAPAQPVDIIHANLGGKGLVGLKLAGVDSRDQAEALRGMDILIPVAEAWPLPDGDFYHYQLVGLAVYDAAGNQRGVLTRVYPGPANDCFAVTPLEGGREQLIPALRSVVISVDLVAGRMVVNWPEEY